MDKRIDGTFINQELIIEEIKNLIKEEGYAPEQLLVITRKATTDFITPETGVEVILTGQGEDDDSLWDKIVNFFTVALDDETEETEEAIFEHYGLNEDTYERFEESLEDGELLLLIDDAAPVNDEPSDFLIRDGIVPDEEVSDEITKPSQPDWVAEDQLTKGDMPAHAIAAEKAIEEGAAEHAMTHDEMNEMVVRDEYEVAQLPKEKITAASEGTEAHPDVKDAVTGQPIEVAPVEGDPTMAEENHEMADMQFDKEESFPEHEEKQEPFSKDPFGGDTVAADEGEDADDIPPVYEQPDKKRPAL